MKKPSKRLSAAFAAVAITALAAGCASSSSTPGKAHTTARPAANAASTTTGIVPSPSNEQNFLNFDPNKMSFAVNTKAGVCYSVTFNEVKQGNAGTFDGTNDFYSGTVTTSNGTIYALSEAIQAIPCTKGVIAQVPPAQRTAYIKKFGVPKT